MTILSEFGLREVKAAPIKKYLSKEAQAWQGETINSSRAIGIEIEVENHKVTNEPPICWQIVDDGSLRNHGAEWITTPILASEAPGALYSLLRESLSDECCFGPRTSVHVHVNAQDLMPNQVKKIVQLYCVFEHSLYNFVGKNRNKNIYCVPLYDTGLTREFRSHRISHICERWSKYTGLNLMPLTSKGTIEFRHMHGCSDPVKLCRWIRLILRLFDYITDEKFEENKFMKQLSPKADFGDLLKSVFKEDTHLLKCSGWDDVKDGIISMQQMYGRISAIADITSKRVIEAPFYQLGI